MPASAAATPTGRRLLFTMLGVIATFGLLVTGAVIVIAGSIRAQARSDEISGCRAAYRVEYIDGPTVRALEAVAEGDQEALEAAVEAADPEGYEALVEQSRLDSDAFLDRCHRDEGGGG